jgi:seryl-tRNA synthetase
MLDINLIRKNPDFVKACLLKRKYPFDIDAFLSLDQRRRTLIAETESLQNKRKETSKLIGQMQKEKRDASALVAETRELGDKLRLLEAELRTAEDMYQISMMSIPNIVHESLPEGDDAGANRIEFTWGEPRAFGFPVRDHVDIGEGLGIIDQKRAAKVASARFNFMLGAGARLERALINFMLDLHTKQHGYREILPPFIINANSLFGTGQLPKFESDLFKLTDERGLYLCPTAEVPVTNFYAEEILENDQLPAAFVAYTPCFRSEAGSYGVDTRGLIRQHQFNKVELVRFSRPEESFEQLELLTGHAEAVLKALELPFRRVTLSTGDIGFGSCKTYDLEVWLPSQNTYREISSCSNYDGFQARRAGIRYRPAAGAKPEFVHTLNGSGLAVGRTLVALLENCQEADGSVRLPPALVPFMDGVDVIRP